MRALFRRRRFILDKRLQYRLLVISVGYVVFFILVMGLALFAPLILKLRGSALESAESLEAARGFLYLHHYFWPAVLLSFVVITLHSILTSHKIAGPLFRFRQMFELVKKGIIPSPTPLRKRDFLHVEMRAINEMLESLRLKLKDIREAQEGLSRAIAEYSAVTETGPAALRQLMIDLAEKGDQLAKKIREFKV